MDQNNIMSIYDRNIDSLGLLEILANEYKIQGTANANFEFCLVIACADHGHRAPSSHVPEQTFSIARKLVQGKSVANKMADTIGVKIQVVNVGINIPGDTHGIEASLVNSCGTANGTKNFTNEPAMTHEMAIHIFEIGRKFGKNLAKKFGTILLGEVGVGNTTTSSIMAWALVGDDKNKVPFQFLVGRGSSDLSVVPEKLRVVQKAILLHRSALSPEKPFDALGAVGGFEIGYLAGVVAGATETNPNIRIVLDGFITSVAVLLAVRIGEKNDKAFDIRKNLVCSHLSTEPGHKFVLEALRLQPAFNFRMRLGEGTGALVMAQLLKMTDSLWQGIEA